ncbi:uncharacterized protein ARMOST_20225 [Armillaria ostoyae]|uniref:Uncharacterized protein n=1 Tax=Armillaria ostoyae TaxID=47428 RepID=A0A284S6V7_ARMOS|nr:uncharacterized protein ARMOST_20225 [Armillaria ostoyae]
MNIVLSLHAVYSLPRDKHTLVWILASSPPQREATAGGALVARRSSLALSDITTLSLKQRVSASTSYRSRPQHDDVSNKPAISQHNDSRMDNPTLPGEHSHTLCDAYNLIFLGQHYRRLWITRHYLPRGPYFAQSKHQALDEPMAPSTRKCSKFLILRRPARLQRWNDTFDYEAVRGSGFACQGMENECAGFGSKVSAFESAHTRLTHHVSASVHSPVHVNSVHVTNSKFRLLSKAA